MAARTVARTTSEPLVERQLLRSMNRLYSEIYIPDLAKNCAFLAYWQPWRRKGRKRTCIKKWAWLLAVNVHVYFLS